MGARIETIRPSGLGSFGAGSGQSFVGESPANLRIGTPIANGFVGGPYTGVQTYQTEGGWGSCDAGALQLSLAECLPVLSRVDDINFAEYTRAAYNAIFANTYPFSSDPQPDPGWTQSPGQWQEAIEAWRWKMSNPDHPEVYAGYEVTTKEALYAQAAAMLDHAARVRAAGTGAYRTIDVPAFHAIIKKTLQALRPGQGDSGSGGSGSGDSGGSGSGGSGGGCPAGLVWDDVTGMCVYAGGGGGGGGGGGDIDSEGLPIWIWLAGAAAVAGVIGGVYLALKK